MCLPVLQQECQNKLSLPDLLPSSNGYNYTAGHWLHGGLHLCFSKAHFLKLNLVGNNEEVLNMNVDLGKRSPSLGEHALNQITNHRG